jgi:hypothetical protein
MTNVPILDLKNDCHNVTWLQGDGWFFVAMELELMLALILMKYDVKLEGLHPENMLVLVSCVPNPKGEAWGEVLFYLFSTSERLFRIEYVLDDLHSQKVSRR